MASALHRVPLMIKTLLTLPFLFGGILFAQISVGIEIGAPPPPRIVARPVVPGPGFVWVEGYWYPVGHHWKWHNGYWTRPPYPGAVWLCPVMTAGASTRVIGKAIAGGWRTIIVGIAAGTEIIATTITTATGAKGLSGEIYVSVP